MEALQEKTMEHIYLTSLSLIFATVIAIPLGIGIVRFSFLRTFILKAGSISQTIPSLAMLAFLVPFLGLGTLPTLVVLTFYAIYPILRSTTTGLENIPIEYIEASKGLGFSSLQRLWHVELPLAFPMIISGLRVATAMTIGIATIAAFIGAGGLGDFIMQGLSLNDSSLILLGAIPIACLALVFDYGISKIEARFQKRKLTRHKIPLFQKLVLASLSLFLIFWGGHTFLKEVEGTHNDKIIIASKNFTEQYILAELMAQLIESRTSLSVKRKFNLGATDIVHQALLKGEIDLYPEYIGTAYVTVLKKTQTTNPTDILQEVRTAYKDKFNLIWLDPFGFSNSQSLAIKKEFAEEHNLYCLSDLTRMSSYLTIAAPPEFLKRADSFPGLNRVYGFSFKNILQIDPNLMYTAIENYEAEVIAAFTTDGKLSKYNLITLKDDKNFYPPYHAAPLIRKSVLDAHPEIYQALSPLFGFISTKDIQKLNYEVDGKGLSPQDVAYHFLVESGLIDEPLP
ncbi:MAG: ABC transporter permease subunit [Alphaproteobacteria bacterium]|nr:ABC transporter permease subunit [Alphaproteobacteria bacterium]